MENVHRVAWEGDCAVSFFEGDEADGAAVRSRLGICFFSLLFSETDDQLLDLLGHLFGLEPQLLGLTPYLLDDIGSTLHIGEVIEGWVELSSPNDTSAQVSDVVRIKLHVAVLVCVDDSGILTVSHLILIL